MEGVGVPKDVPLEWEGVPEGEGREKGGRREGITLRVREEGGEQIYWMLKNEK